MNVIYLTENRQYAEASPDHEGIITIPERNLICGFVDRGKMYAMEDNNNSILTPFEVFVQFNDMSMNMVQDRFFQQENRQISIDGNTFCETKQVFSCVPYVAPTRKFNEFFNTEERLYRGVVESEKELLEIKLLVDNVQFGLPVYIHSDKRYKYLFAGDPVYNERVYEIREPGSNGVIKAVGTYADPRVGRYTWKNDNFEIGEENYDIAGFDSIRPETIEVVNMETLNFGHGEPVNPEYLDENPDAVLITIDFTENGIHYHIVDSKITVRNGNNDLIVFLNYPVIPNNLKRISFYSMRGNVVVDESLNGGTASARSSSFEILANKDFYTVDFPPL